MHILILTTVFPPEVRSASQIMFELAETLKNIGNEVTVITSLLSDFDANNKQLNRFYQKTEKEGISIIRVSTIPIHKSKAPAFFRGIGQILNCIAYFLVSLKLKKVDISISYSPPLALGITGCLLNLTKKIPHVFNLQDLVPQYAIDLGILKNKTLINIIKKIEYLIYSKVQFITVHSNGNKDYVVGEGFDSDKVKVIPNWVDTELVSPMDKQNQFRKINGLTDKFVVLFAGVLGYAQDLDTLIEAGTYLNEYPEIKILIVGEGVEKERLIKKALELKLKNIIFHNFVSKEEYPEVVAASDVCIATLQKDLLCPVIPSKILGYMSAGRPVITSLSLDGDAPHVINNALCGICVSPGKPEKIAKAIIEMYQNKEKYIKFGENGRKYIVKNHQRLKCIKLYEEIFKKLINN